MIGRLSALLLSIIVFVNACGPAAPQAETEELLHDEAADRLAQISGRIELSGLEEPVEVLRDKWGVAHIYAKTQHDLFFSQGFVAAQDRLYQIEIWRRTGTGELAEVFGPDFVERDRMARLVRYRGDMKSEWESYSPDTEAIANAFVEGVNAYVESVGDRLPVEFSLLGFRPGVWEPEHCILRIAGLMMTRNARQEVARAEMLFKLGAEITERYFPTDPVTTLRIDDRVDLTGIDRGVIESYRKAIEIPTLHSQDASNNWVVGGELSATGRPLLASDPHRSVTLPSLRYLVHLVGPGWNVIGSGEPALPGVALGHNERVGWGFTIVQYDQVDLYVETTNPENPKQYRYQDNWLDMEIESETIRVKGQQPVQVELKYTRHGPVIWEDPDNHRVVAVRWAGMEPGTAGYLGSLAMDRVQGWDDFVEAMGRWKIPAENIVYADIDGDIGWIPAGLMPIRDNWLGLLPVPGHTGEYEWSGFRDVDELPRIKNPAQQFIATANHNILPEDYPYALGFDWSAPYRFLRVEEVLRSGEKFTVEDFKELQHDETSLPARRLVGLLRQLPEAGSDEFQTARRILEDWDLVMGRDSQAAALFEIWQEETLVPEFVEAVLPEDARDLVARNLALPTLFDLIEEMPSENRDPILAKSLEKAFGRARELLGEDVTAWRWGSLHKVLFTHPLANNQARRTVFNRGPIERGGDAYTPLRTSGDEHIQRHGASYRHILDFADWDRSVFTSAPGQSGQPGSPHYDDLLELWGNYQYAPLVYTREAVEAATINRLNLEPIR
jgi:penicillin amidase